MKVFVLGVGATGSLLAKLLVRQGHQVMCGDRDPTRARAFLGEHSTLVIQRVHARNVRSIVKAAKGGVRLAAQDEVVTIPHVLRVREMDAKIGGIDMERLRRWYRQGKLTRSRGLVEARFPATPTPRAMSKLVRRGILRNERFAAAILVYGRKRTRPFMVRWDALFPSLYELRHGGLTCSPVAWSAAQITALFVKYMPKELAGVYAPEALPIATRRNILKAARSRGIRLTKTVTRLKPSDKTHGS